MQDRDLLNLIQLPSDELAALLNDLGVIQPPGALYLARTLQPVSIVDSRVSLEAVATPPEWDAEQSNGEQVTAVAGTILADTGQLAAGTYEFLFWSSHTEAGTNGVRFQHRNAANSANISAHCFGLPNGGNIITSKTYTLALNERVRILLVANAAAGAISQATIYYRGL